jgi:hypothetical protein
MFRPIGSYPWLKVESIAFRECKAVVCFGKPSANHGFAAILPENSREK